MKKSREHDSIIVNVIHKCEDDDTKSRCFWCHHQTCLMEKKNLTHFAKLQRTLSHMYRSHEESHDMTRYMWTEKVTEILLSIVNHIKFEAAEKCSCVSRLAKKRRREGEGTSGSCGKYYAIWENSQTEVCNGEKKTLQKRQQFDDSECELSR